MIDLSDISGLPIKMDEETGTIFYDNSLTFHEQVNVLITDIVPVLLNKFIRYPEQVYTRHIGVCNCAAKKSAKLAYDLFQLPSGLLGIEYIKTDVFFAKFKAKKYACFVEVIKGSIDVVIQRNSKRIVEAYSISTYVDEMDIIELSPGDRFAVPSGVYYSFVNVGREQAIFTVLYSNLEKIDYQVLQREKGLAFFIISKNAKVEIVANPKYTFDEKPAQRSFRSLSYEDKSKYVSELIDECNSLFNLYQKKTKEVIKVLA